MGGTATRTLAPWAVVASVFPIVADGLHLLFWEPLNQAFVAVLTVPSERAAWLLLGLYALYVVSLGLLGRLEPSVKLRTVVLYGRDEQTGQRTRTEATWPDLLLLYPTYGFGIIMVYAVIRALIGEDIEPVVSSNQGGMMMLVAVIIFIGHMVIRGFDDPRWAPSDRAYTLALIPIVLVGEVVLNLSHAMMVVTFGPDPSVPVEDPSVLWSFLLMTPVYLLFFAAPRFTFMHKSFTWPSLVSGLCLALYTVWRFVSVDPVI